MSKKVTSIVAYIGIIGWLVAFLAGDKEGAKVHLNQALVLDIISIICNCLAGIAIIGTIAGLVSVVCFVLCIMGIVYAAKDQDKELPLVGGIKILK